MPDEQDKLKLKIEEAEAAVAHAQKEYAEAEPGQSKIHPFSSFWQKKLLCWRTKRLWSK